MSEPPAMPTAEIDTLAALLAHATQAVTALSGRIAQCEIDLAEARALIEAQAAEVNRLREELARRQESPHGG